MLQTIVYLRSGRCGRPRFLVARLAGARAVTVRASGRLSRGSGTDGVGTSSPSTGCFLLADRNVRPSGTGPCFRLSEGRTAGMAVVVTVVLRSRVVPAGPFKAFTVGVDVDCVESTLFFLRGAARACLVSFIDSAGRSILLTFGTRASTPVSTCFLFREVVSLPIIMMSPVGSVLSSTAVLSSLPPTTETLRMA